MYPSKIIGLLLSVVAIGIFLVLVYKPEERFSPIPGLYGGEIVPISPMNQTYKKYGWGQGYISYQDLHYDKLCTPLKPGESKLADSPDDCLEGELYIYNGYHGACQCSLWNKCLQNGIC